VGKKGGEAAGVPAPSGGPDKASEDGEALKADRSLCVCVCVYFVRDYVCRRFSLSVCVYYAHLHT
jgi:hypothetical protein